MPEPIEINANVAQAHISECGSAAATIPGCPGGSAHGALEGRKVRRMDAGAGARLPLYAAYMRRQIAAHRKYTPHGLATRAEPQSHPPAGLPLRADERDARSLSKGPNSMLDVIYLVIGAVFLGACVLYAYACDRL